MVNHKQKDFVSAHDFTIYSTILPFIDYAKIGAVSPAQLKSVHGEAFSDLFFGQAFFLKKDTRIALLGEIIVNPALFPTEANKGHLGIAQTEHGNSFFPFIVSLPTFMNFI